jgi:predicted ArsR family transcriptional regulator
MKVPSIDWWGDSSNPCRRSNWQVRTWIAKQHVYATYKEKNDMNSGNESVETQVSRIPKTGRIGRFAKIVEEKTSQGILLEIMQDSENYKAYKPAEKAEWWRTAIERLEKATGKESAIEIMKSCGRKCCGQGQRNTAKRLMGESASVQEFLDRISRHDVKEGDLTYVLEDENTIVAEHNKCFCGQVKRTTKPFSTNTYCQCSVEFNRAFFEAALEKPVQVELVQSIINGAESCKFIIHILV